MAADQSKAADKKVRETVEHILADIEERGDKAIREYSEKFDKWSPPSFRLTKEQIDALVAKVEPRALDEYASHRRRYVVLPKRRKQRFATSKSRHSPASLSATKTFRCRASGAMFPADDIR